MIESATTAHDPDVLNQIGDALAADAVFDSGEDGERHFRIGAEPFALAAQELAFLAALGDHLLAFYQALNSLHRRSQRGTAPAFAANWLDRGKPQDVIRLGRMGRFKSAVPRIIRPDLFWTDQGPKIAELDSVPGGMGLLSSLNHHYAAAGHEVIGGADGIPDAMTTLFRQVAKVDNPTVAIVVSDEADAYRAEMTHLALRIKGMGLSCHVLHPKEVLFGDDVLSFEQYGERVTIDVLYRFFELFDLANIPKAELMLYAAKKGTVVMTPPPKAQLEEKLSMALLHHPALASFWRAELPGDSFAVLKEVFPHTWVLDPAPIPPHSTIPGLLLAGEPVQSWDALKTLRQKQRELVVKPSGFSETAWGSRGVVIGHDTSEADWADALDAALAAFDTTPHVLQPFHKAKRHQIPYLGSEGGIAKMGARARICPYYFVEDTEHGQKVKLAGIMATLCPQDKKRIHGMRDAVMVPCR